jgi:hypothetical protein
LKGISYIFLGYDGTLPTSNDEGSTPIKARSRYWPEGWFALGDMADERELAGVEGRLSCLFVCFFLFRSRVSFVVSGHLSLACSFEVLGQVRLSVLFFLSLAACERGYIWVF